jgi:O-antigen ligase
LGLILSGVLGLSLLVAHDATVSALGRVAFVGRDDSSVTSLGGRVGIWQDVSNYVRERPVLGYGYLAFWTPARISEVSWEENWAVPHSHSIYVEYLLGLGTVGLASYMLLFVAGIRRAFALHRFSQNPTFAFCGALLVFYALDGFFECPLFEGSLMMFLCMVVLVRLGFVCVQGASSVGRAQRLRGECYGLHVQREEISTERLGTNPIPERGSAWVQSPTSL